MAAQDKDPYDFEIPKFVDFLALDQEYNAQHNFDFNGKCFYNNINGSITILGIFSLTIFATLCLSNLNYPFQRLMDGVVQPFTVREAEHSRRKKWTT